ncbi:MAG: hypothetical protein U1F71_09950 [Verrucomicrobiaceae bacterium]
MSRHHHDDYSFLPTVDSTDEERDHAIKQRLWEAQHASQEPHEKTHEVEHTTQAPVEEIPAHEEPAHEHAQVIAPPPMAEMQRLEVPKARSSKKVRVFEPDAADHPHEQPHQDGREMWEAYSAQHHEVRAEEVVVPRKATPRVSLGGGTERPLMIEEHATAHPHEDAGHVHVRSVTVDEAAEPADNQKSLQAAKRRALLMTLGVHVAVALILLLLHVPMLEIVRPEIVATSAVEQLENESWKKVTAAMPQTSAMAASVSPMLSTAASDIAMPDLNFAANTNELNLGTSFGSFGSGVTTGGVGGKVSFLGNTATAKHVVFVVDVSGSMSASMNVQGSGLMSRFDLLKKELSKSISAMASGTAYQILFFSDFAWPHDALDSNDMRALNNYEWKITATSRNVSIPRFSYLAANGTNISKSKKIIAEANNPGGTNWGSGLLMALKGSPKPDVIFFMTDGNRNDEQGWIDAVTQENSRGKRTIIHTTAMGTPDAARDLDAMAKRNGGKFTAVMADGKIVQGKDLLP